MLDDLFGADAYQIVDIAPEACAVKASWVDVSFGYDWRDQWLNAQFVPRRAPEELIITCEDHIMLQFCGSASEKQEYGALTDRLVAGALERIRPIVDIFKDERRTRDALWFARGYSQAYGDWASGRWS